MGFVVLGVLEENLVHVGARILVQLVARTEDNQGDLAVAQYRQFVRLLHHAEFPLVKGHLSHIKAERGGCRIEGEPQRGLVPLRPLKRDGQTQPAREYLSHRDN